MDNNVSSILKYESNSLLENSDFKIKYMNNV